MASSSAPVVSSSVVSLAVEHPTSSSIRRKYLMCWGGHLIDPSYGELVKVEPYQNVDPSSRELVMVEPYRNVRELLTRKYSGTEWIVYTVTGVGEAVLENIDQCMDRVSDHIVLIPVDPTRSYFPDDSKAFFPPRHSSLHSMAKYKQATHAEALKMLLCDLDTEKRLEVMRKETHDKVKMALTTRLHKHAHVLHKTRSDGGPPILFLRLCNTMDYEYTSDEDVKSDSLYKYEYKASTILTNVAKWASLASPHMLTLSIAGRTYSGDQFVPLQDGGHPTHIFILPNRLY